MPVYAPTYEKLSVPLAAAVATPLLQFWERLFATSFAGLQPVLAGAEQAFNADTIYVARCDGELAGTCRLTICRSNPALGLLGEVATEERFRGAGIG